MENWQNLLEELCLNRESVEVGFPGVFGRHFLHLP